MLTGLLISLPLIFSLLLFAIKDQPVLSRKIALAASLLTFAVGVLILLKYLSNPAGYPLFHPDIFHSLGIEFTIGMDGLSMLLVLLTDRKSVV